jgi:hypothetical protein
MKREVGVLGRQMIKKNITSLGGSILIRVEPLNLYSRTSKRFATPFSSISQRSPQGTLYVPLKT